MLSKKKLKSSLWIFVREHKRNLFMTIERTYLGILDQSFSNRQQRFSVWYICTLLSPFWFVEFQVLSSSSMCFLNSFLTIWISSIQNCKPLLSSVCALYREACWSYHLLSVVNAFTQIVLLSMCFIMNPAKTIILSLIHNIRVPFILRHTDKEKLFEDVITCFEL